MLLAGLADVASTPSGAHQLSNAVALQPEPLDRLKNLLEGDRSAEGASRHAVAGLIDQALRRLGADA